MYNLKIINIYLLSLLLYLLSGCGENLKRRDIQKVSCNDNNNLNLKDIQIDNSNDNDIVNNKEVLTDRNLVQLDKHYERIDLTNEIRLIDIPFIKDKNIIKLDVNNNNFENKLALKYFCNLSIDEIIDFYRVELDYNGWQEISIFNGEDSLLAFQKPSKKLFIYIKNRDNKSIIYIFLEFNNKI